MFISVRNLPKSYKVFTKIKGMSKYNKKTLTYYNKFSVYIYTELSTQTLELSNTVAISHVAF